MSQVCFWTSPAWCLVYEVQQEDCSTQEVLGQRSSLDSEAAVAVVCSGAWNSQSAGVSGSKTPAGDCWRRLAMHLKVLWSHVVQTLVDQDCCLKRDPLSNRQLSRLPVVTPSNFDVSWLQVQPYRLLVSCRNGGLRISGLIGHVWQFSPRACQCQPAFIKLTDGSMLESTGSHGKC